MDVENKLKYKKELKNKMDRYKSKLINLYNRANTKSKKLRIMCDLMSFSEVYKNLFPDEDLICWELDEELIDLLLLDDSKSLNEFINHINDNNDLYSCISYKVIKDYSSVEYPFYKNRFVSWDKLNRLSKKEIVDIVSSFLNFYDNRMYSLFKEKVENLELLAVDNYENYDGYEGFTNNIECLNLNFIFLNMAYGNNIDTAVTLIHENAHCFEFDLQHDKNMSLLSYNTPFSEVCPCFFEYAFLNYLKDNKICFRDTNLCFDLYFKQAFSSMFEVNLLTKMEEVNLCENNSIYFNDIVLNNYANKLKDKVNYYDLVNLEDEIKVVDSYIYGFGRLFGVYMYENYKKDPELFKRNLNNVLCNYPLVNDISTFENVGVNKIKLLNSSVLKKELIKHIKDF